MIAGLCQEKVAMYDQESGGHLVWLQECTALTGESPVTVHDSPHNTCLHNRCPHNRCLHPCAFVSLGQKGT